MCSCNSCRDTTHTLPPAGYSSRDIVHTSLLANRSIFYLCDGRNFCRISGHLQNKPEMHQGWRARLLLTRNVEAADEVVEKRRCSVYMRGAYRVRPSKHDEVLFGDGKHARYCTVPGHAARTDRGRKLIDTACAGVSNSLERRLMTRSEECVTKVKAVYS
jgi:hypothetical protein